jgi:hypothetical protein
VINQGWHGWQFIDGWVLRKLLHPRNDPLSGLENQTGTKTARVVVTSRLHISPHSLVDGLKLPEGAVGVGFGVGEANARVTVEYARFGAAPCNFAKKPSPHFPTATNFN